MPQAVPPKPAPPAADDAVVAAVAAGLMFETTDRHWKRLQLRKSTDAKLDEQQQQLLNSADAEDNQDKEQRP